MEELKMKHGKEKEKKKNGALKIILRILIILIIIILIIAGIGTGFIMDKLNKLKHVNIDSTKLGIDSATQENLSGYRNIALFGIDSRSKDDYGTGNRSDCIIIASINNKTKEVKLVSVYRDSYLNIDGHGLDKVTHAYSYGGPELAINTLNRNLDLNISEFVTVNWKAVADAVNELGGVTINVESYELSAVNDTVAETATVVDESATKIPYAGTQTLNGVQAVAYARTRYTDGGDYKRTERMRDVVIAMVDKIKSKNVGEINTFVDNIFPEIYTNISSSNILSMIPSLKSYKISNNIGWPYEVKGITLDRWYGVPVTLESNVKKLHQEIFGEDNYTVPDNVKKISNSIINKTGYKN
jgi:LCP family protein required for cell wall assembly